VIISLSKFIYVKVAVQLLDTKLFSIKDIEKLITLDDCIKIVERVYKLHGNKKIVMPAKLTMDLGESGEWPNYNSYVNSMPGYIGDIDVSGVKIVGGFWKNTLRPLPSIMGIISLLDSSSGEFLAIMEGSYITSLRTGAQAAVGAKYLAKKNSRILGIIGAGVQNRFTVQAISKIFELEKILIFDINKESSQKFCDDMSKLVDVKFEICKASSDVMNADIVVSATNSKKPVIFGDKIIPGSLIIALGSYKEIDANTCKIVDKIIVDHLEQALHRGVLKDYINENIIQIDDIYSEIFDILLNKKSGRSNDNEIIMFNPIGMGSTDIAVAHHIYDASLKTSVGSKFKFI